MGGIIVFNKHLTFLVIVLVLIARRLLVCTVCYLIESHGQTHSNFVHLKELKISWLWYSTGFSTCFALDSPK